MSKVDRFRSVSEGSPDRVIDLTARSDKFLAPEITPQYLSAEAAPTPP
jgi:hypothetical protein